MPPSWDNAMDSRWVADDVCAPVALAPMGTKEFKKKTKVSMPRVEIRGVSRGETSDDMQRRDTIHAGDDGEEDVDAESNRISFDEQSIARTDTLQPANLSPLRGRGSQASLGSRRAVSASPTRTGDKGAHS